MNRNQWFMLSIIFWTLMVLFIKIDTNFNCDTFSDTDEALDKYDIWCIVNSEIYDPFIWVFAILGITFFIGAWLEPQKK